MPACPWCKAAVGDLLAPCPRCGRTSDEQSAVPGLSGVPELDIPARVSKASAPKVAVAPAPAPVRASAGRIARSEHADQADRDEKANNAFADPGARTFDAEDDDGLEGGSLDLDLSKGPPLIADAPASAPKASPAAAGAPKVAPPAPSPGAPLAKVTRPAKVEVDPYEARALADYGDAPAAWWKTPQYAFRVLRRRPELKKIADQKKREAERAEGAAEDALLSLAEIVRPEAEKLGAYAGALQGVRATEQVLGERDAILASETDAHKQRQAEHDAKIAELEAQLSQIQIEERQVAGELAEADTLLKRAEARAKRIEIEMRNALAQAQSEQAAQAGQGVPVGGPKGPGA